MKKAVSFGFFFFLISTAVAASTSTTRVDVSTATGHLITYDNKTGLSTIEGDAVLVNSTGTLKGDKIRMNSKSKKGSAEGHVVMIQSSSTLSGNYAEYDWGAGTGTIDAAIGTGQPWRFNAQQLVMRPDRKYELTDGEVTSCDLDPPHYKIEAKHGVVDPGKRLTLYNADLVMGDTPTLWLPVYSKSLVPKKYRLRIEPGSSSRDGFTNKTIFGYPYTQNSWTDLRWDYLQNTGDGFGVNHRYFAPTAKGDLDAYYIHDSNPDLEVPRSTRYTVLWDHYQKLTSRLSMNAHTDIKSDQTFGNSFSGAGNGVLVENSQRGLTSDGGLTYQMKNATLLAQFSRTDKFDTTVSSHEFVSQVILPSLSMNTAPLISKRFPVYTTFTTSFINQSQLRNDPLQSLRYQRTIASGVDFRKELRIQKATTITPIVDYSETWENRVLTSSGVVSEKDQYVGRYTLGTDLRRRITRDINASVHYRYGVRFAGDRTTPDVLADDHGIETNLLSYDTSARIGRNTLLTLASGYDYRADPFSLPGKYRHVSSRVTSPSADLQYEIKPGMTVFFRETYALVDPSSLAPLRTPANTSGEFQWGTPAALTFFSQGFSFTKAASGTPSQLFLNNKFKFYLTPKWYVDLLLSYEAQGRLGVDYSKVFPIEKTLRLVRDLHCWIFRMEVSKRPDQSEISFYIDLKSNANANSSVFDKTRQQNYATSTRRDGPQIDQIFPSGPND